MDVEAFWNSLRLEIIARGLVPSKFVFIHSPYSPTLLTHLTQTSAGVITQGRTKKSKEKHIPETPVVIVSLFFSPYDIIYYCFLERELSSCNES